MPFKRKRDGKWMGQVRIRGERFTSPPFNLKSEAKDWETARRNETSPQASTACGELAEAYIDVCRLKFVPRTVAMKETIFKALFKSIPPQTYPWAVTPGQALGHLAKVAKDRSGYVANTHRTHLVAWWNWMVKFHALQAVNPFLAVDRFPANKLPKRVPTMDEFLQVLNFAQGQDKILLLAYLHTAARRCELFKMTWADVDFGSKRLRLWTNKTRGQGSRSDWIDMTEELASELLSWRSENPNTIPVFHHKGIPYTTRHTWLPGLCREAGVEPFHYHAIRHLTATYLVHQGEPLPVVSSILRHRSLVVTERYVRNLKTQRDALKILPFGNKANTEPTIKKVS